MLSAFVSEKKFLESVSRYLQAHRYGNTVTKDLWDSLSGVTGEIFYASSLKPTCVDRLSGVDIPALMDSWIKKV